MKIYVDGQIDGTPFGQAENLVFSSNTDLLIGHQFDCYGRRYGYTGLIDDVRIYNRALSDDEVKALASVGDEAPAPLPTHQTAAVAFRAAEDYERAHAGDTEGCIRRYRKVAANFPATPEAGKALVNVVRLESAAARRPVAPGGWRQVFDGRTPAFIGKPLARPGCYLASARLNIRSLRRRTKLAGSSS